MRYLFLFVIAIISFWSCKKDKLEGDKEIFIDKWKWIYSISTSDHCSGNPTSTNIITPASHGKNYYVEFIYKGKVFFYEETEEVDEKRIKFEHFYLATQSYLTNAYDFVIYLDNNENNTLSGEINEDTLIINSKFPFNGNPCVRYTNYFIRN